MLNRSCLLCAAGYKFFEDMYPKHDPAPRFATYEDQMKSPVVKSYEVKKQQLTEHDKLVKLHKWKEVKDGYVPPPEFGWTEEWGPEPGDEGHVEWYKKQRMYMSYDEKSRYSLRSGMPLEKNSMRAQELPYHHRQKAAFYNLEERNPQFDDLRKRNAWAKFSYEDERDTIIHERDAFLQEWLDKPGVEKENVGKEIADYNGTGERHKIKCIPRRPEWELSPHTSRSSLNNNNSNKRRRKG